MTSASPREIVSAHSPDSDDAFMFYGLATKKVRSPKVTFRHVLEDIETLNRKAMEGQYELSAISYHALSRCTLDTNSVIGLASQQTILEMVVMLVLFGTP